jgi:hypothetical protein
MQVRPEDYGLCDTSRPRPPTPGLTRTERSASSSWARWIPNLTYASRPQEGCMGCGGCFSREGQPSMSKFPPLAFVSGSF